MIVRIVERRFGGVEFSPEMRVLHLGGQTSANVERLEFLLPEEWQGRSVTLHIQRQDGTLPTPILLDENGSCAVGKEFTASARGSWMLLALGDDGYRALTRPARYECYETLATDGGAEISPTQYETFVARVLSYANDAQSSAKEARNAAAQAKGYAEEAQAAQTATAQAADEMAKAQAGTKENAAQAEEAAARAEGYAPKDGTVLSVNGKGGAVVLGAADVKAVPEDSAGYVKSLGLTGRTITLTLGDGTVQQLQTQDTTELKNMTGVLSADNGGTGKKGALTAQDVGAVASGSRDYLKSAEAQGGTLTLSYGNGEQKKFTVDLTGYYTKEEVDRMIAAQKLTDHPVGSIYQSTSPTNPANLFGGTWQQIAADRVLMGASSTHKAGTTAEAGLPDITGNFTGLSRAGFTTEGAFSVTSSGMWSIGDEGSNRGYPAGVDFDASRSSAVYGGSDTVQPAAYYVYIWLRTA